MIYRVREVSIDPEVKQEKMLIFLADVRTESILLRNFSLCRIYTSVSVFQGKTPRVWLSQN